MVTAEKKLGINLSHDAQRFTISAKLDGLAGKYENNILSTRGNGQHGFAITDVFKKGIVIDTARKSQEQLSGLGEIVIANSYYFGGDVQSMLIFIHSQN